MLAHGHNEELDRGPRQGVDAPERFCVATRSAKPRAELIRFVVGPDATVLPDLKGKLPGRGAWVTATRAALTQAVKKNAFARAFRREVRPGADLVTMTEALLLRAALDALAIARKAGRIAIGSAKVEAALQEDHIRGLLRASDAAADGARKIDAALRRRPGGESDPPPIVTAFTGAQLDLALGRANVVHAALLAGPESATFLARVERLERFRTGSPGDAGDRDTPPNLKPEDRDRHE